jgi:predicted thioesterase
MLNVPDFKVGDSLTLQKIVTDTDTALNYGSGQLENLLSTPSLVALMIEASVKLLDRKLPEGYITVGKMAQVVHEKPSLLGDTVSVKVEITGFDGSRIQILMTAYDEFGQIGVGSHERYIVNKASLLKRAAEREEYISRSDY